MNNYLKEIGTDLKNVFKFQKLNLIRYKKCLEEVKKTGLKMTTNEPQIINFLTPPTTIKKKKKHPQKIITSSFYNNEQYHMYHNYLNLKINM